MDPKLLHEDDDGWLHVDRTMFIAGDPTSSHNVKRGECGVLYSKLLISKTKKSPPTSITLPCLVLSAAATAASTTIFKSGLWLLAMFVRGRKRAVLIGVAEGSAHVLPCSALPTDEPQGFFVPVGFSPVYR
jgi:hypothetical protein